MAPRFERLMMYRSVVGQWQPVRVNGWAWALFAYSIAQQVFGDAGGLEYNAGCWIMRMVAQRFVTDVDKMSSGYFPPAGAERILRGLAPTHWKCCRAALPATQDHSANRCCSSDIYR